MSVPTAAEKDRAEDIIKRANWRSAAGLMHKTQYAIHNEKGQVKWSHENPCILVYLLMDVRVEEKNKGVSY